jgi:hypothetical protein
MLPGQLCHQDWGDILLLAASMPSEPLLLLLLM